MTYEEYKKKHDWYSNSADTLEKQLANGRERLEETKGQLAAAREEANLASANCLNKPATDVTPEEWARSEAADKRVGVLDAKRVGIEEENGRTQAGLDTARELRSELENANPDFKERNIREAEAEMMKPETDPGMGKAATGMQAYAGVAAVAVSLNMSSPSLPSNVEQATAVDPAAIEKQTLKELDFENLPTSMRDKMREDSKPLRDSIYEQHPPGGGGGGNSPGGSPGGPPDDPPSGGGSGAPVPPPSDTVGAPNVQSVQYSPDLEQRSQLANERPPDLSTSSGAYSVQASHDPRLSYEVNVPPPDDSVGSTPNPNQPAPSVPAPQNDGPLLLTSDRENQKLLTDQRVAAPAEGPSDTATKGSAPETQASMPQPGNDIPSATSAVSSPPPKNDMSM